MAEKYEEHTDIEALLLACGLGKRAKRELYQAIADEAQARIEGDKALKDRLDGIVFVTDDEFFAMLDEYYPEA